MSTPVGNDTRSERILGRHNESKINSLNAHELFVAKTMLNYPPLGCAIRCSHCNQVEISNFSSTIANPILLEESMDPGQQLFEQLTQNGRKRDFLLVPDLATDWFRKQKIFLDKISPEELQCKKVSSKTAESLSNFQKCECWVPTQQYNERRLARWRELKKRKLCQQYWQSESNSCTRVTSNQVQKFEKRYVKTEQSQKAKKQLTVEGKNFDRNSISTCKLMDNMSSSKKNKEKVGPVSCLKLPFRCQCLCKQTWRKRNFNPYVFQADGQPMSGDCLSALRTEPLLPRLRRKYDLRKAPQRQLNPTHFRRISPEFYSLLKQYEDGMTRQYPLYGKSIRIGNTKPCYPCKERIKIPVDDEAVKSLSEKSKTQLLSALSEYTHDKKVNKAVGDGGDSSTQESSTATMESFLQVEVPCTAKTCTALKHEPPILNNCDLQYANTSHLKPMNQDKKKPLSAKSNSGICGCFRPRQPLETEVNGIGAASPQSDVTHCKLPHYQSFSTTQRHSGSHNFIFQDGISIEHSSQPESRNTHIGFLGGFAYICKRAQLPGRHLLYNFSNKNRPNREEHGIKRTGKLSLTKRHSKQPHQRRQDIYNASPSLFKTHPAPCCWHLHKCSKISNSHTTLKADHSTQNVRHSCCHITDFQTLECSCRCTGNIDIQDDMEKRRRIELANICVPKSSHLATNIKILHENQNFSKLSPDATESNEHFFGHCEHSKSHCGASHNLPSESSLTVKFCEPSYQSSQIETTNSSACCNNDKCNRRNDEDIVKINLLKLECSSLTEPKHKAEKISVDPKAHCLMRKLPCTHACFLASDYLQLMHRVGRKRVTVSPKRKSVRLKDSSQKETAFKRTPNIVLVSHLYPRLSNAGCFKANNVCGSHKSNPQCSKKQSQKESQAEKISNSQRNNPLKQKHCYASSDLETKKTNCNRIVRYTKISTFNKSGSLDSSLDNHILSQNQNNVPSKLFEFSKYKSGLSDSHTLNMLQPQNMFDQTSLSFNRNSSFNSGYGKLRSISSHRQPWYPSDQQKSKLECTSSSTASYSRSSSSVNVKDDIRSPPVHTQNHSSVWLLTVPKKNTKWSFKEQTDGTTYKKAGIGNLPEKTWIKHCQYANTLQPSESNNVKLDIATSMPSKMDSNCINFSNKQVNGKNLECFQQSDGSKTKLHKHPNFSQQKNFVFKKYIMATTNDSCDLGTTLLSKTPWRWRTAKTTSKILNEHLQPRYGHLPISSPLNRIGSQQCHFKWNRHINTQIKAPKCKKKSWFAVRRLGHSTSLTRVPTTKASSIYWPRVPAPSATCLIHDVGYKLNSVPKDNQTSVDCIQYRNRRYNSVICHFRKTDNSKEEQQNICMEASPRQPQLHKHSYTAKFLDLNTAGKEEFARRRMILEKRHKQKYCHNHAGLLLSTRRPPPPQLRTFTTDYRQQHVSGLKKRHICQSQHLLQFDGQCKEIQDKVASKTKKQCNGIFDEKKDYKRLKFTQRSTSGCDVPIQKEDRNQLACSNDKQRHHHCNYPSSSELSIVQGSHIKQKKTTGTSSGFIYKSTSKHHVNTQVPNWLNCVDDDSLLRRTRTNFVNDNTYMKESGKRNDTRTLKFTSNAETSLKSRLTCFPINTNSSLVSSFDKITIDFNRKCLEKASSNAPLHKQYTKRHPLRPVSVFSDLDFYTHSLERTQPTLQPALQQGESNKHTYSELPTSSGTLLNNLRSKNISGFPLPTIHVNNKKSTTCTFFLNTDGSN